MLETIWDGLEVLSKINERLNGYVTPIVRKIPEKWNRNFIYSLGFTVATQLVYHTVNDFIPIIGIPAALLLTFITGAIIQRNPCNELYNGFAKEHNLLSALVNGLYAVTGCIIISQLDNTLPYLAGLAVLTAAHPSFVSMLGEQIKSTIEASEGKNL